jgi:hypothetical protein
LPTSYALIVQPRQIGVPLRLEVGVGVEAANRQDAAVAALHHAIGPDNRGTAVGFGRVAEAFRVEIGGDRPDLRLRGRALALAGL